MMTMLRREEGRRRQRETAKSKLITTLKREKRKRQKRQLN